MFDRTIIIINNNRRIYSHRSCEIFFYFKGKNKKEMYEKREREPQGSSV